MRGEKLKDGSHPGKSRPELTPVPPFIFRRANLRQSDRIGNVAGAATKAVHHASSEASEHHIGRKALTVGKAPLKLNCHG
jgi:hypothetical protein